MVNADSDLPFQRFPGRLRIARPDPAAPLRDAEVPIAVQAPRPQVRACRNRPLIIELMPLDPLKQVEPIALVRPPGIDARIDKTNMLWPITRDVSGVQRLA